MGFPLVPLEEADHAEGKPQHHFARVLDLQRAQLLDDEEQAEEPGQARAVQVLPALSEAHGPQGRESLGQ
jgi:hypothetical protein